jgi:hypothetical protein
MSPYLAGNAYGSRSFAGFYESVRFRLHCLQKEAGACDWVMPVGIVLVLPNEHGGSTISDEIVKRFQLLDKTSRDYIDFHYLGWDDFRRTGNQDWQLTFDLDAFVEAKAELAKIGIQFGGYADLLVLDASIDAKGVCKLHFGKCLHMDIARAMHDKAISGVGDFMEWLIYLAGALPQGIASPTFYFSDHVGAIYARESLLDFILNKWGAFFGAQKLKYMSVKNYGNERTID